jgi:hypothetical protein
VDGHAADGHAADGHAAGGHAAHGAAAGGAGGHTHSTELARWDQAYPAGLSAQRAGLSAAQAGPSAARAGPSAAQAGPSAARAGPSAAQAGAAAALGDLIVATVRAAVIAPEPEARRWFSWQWYWTGTLVDELIAAGRLRRVDDHLTAR